MTSHFFLRSRYRMLSLILCLIVALTSCATSDHYNYSNGDTPASTPAPPKPIPPPPPPKTPELFSRCGISNGEGRIFYATDSSQDIAEAKARRECEMYSRHCVLLDCNSTTEFDE